MLREHGPRVGRCFCETGENRDTAMKLKYRMLGSIAGLSFLCSCIYLLNTLPKFIEFNNTSYRVRKLVPRIIDSDAHFSALRKRLNKSNYTSDEFSPETGDIERGRSGGREDWEIHEETPAKFTDEDVDAMMDKLGRTFPKLFDIEELRVTPYDTVLWNIKKRNRKKGIYLPGYANLEEEW